MEDELRANDIKLTYDQITDADSARNKAIDGAEEAAEMVRNGHAVDLRENVETLKAYRGAIEKLTKAKIQKYVRDNEPYISGTKQQYLLIDERNKRTKAKKKKAGGDVGENRKAESEEAAKKGSGKQRKT